MFPRVTHPSATKPEGFVRLACVRPAASVHSEPGSNSQVESTEMLSLTSNLRTSACIRHRYRSFRFMCSCFTKKQEPTNREAFPGHRSATSQSLPCWADMLRVRRRCAQTAHISLHQSHLQRATQTTNNKNRQSLGASCNRKSRNLRQPSVAQPPLPFRVTASPSLR